MTNKQIMLSDSDLAIDSECSIGSIYKEKGNRFRKTFQMIKKKLCPEYEYEYEYIEHVDKDFSSKLGKFTFGLDKVIPWSESNVIFT